MDFFKLIVKRKWNESATVIGLELTGKDNDQFPAIQPGSHIEIVIENQKNQLRQYSLINAPHESTSYLLGIKLEPLSRGGSKWMHDLNIGDVVYGKSIKNLFSLNQAANKSILIAGGIGITPTLSMAQFLYQENKSFELHYFVHSEEDICFINKLKNIDIEKNVFIYSGLDHVDIALKLRNITSEPNLDTHVYCCGPSGLMNLVEDLTIKNWPIDNVHFERFKSDQLTAQPDDLSFTVITQKTGFECVVLPNQSIVEALSNIGCEIETSCEQGVCGSCMTNVISGKPDHRDVFLTKSEKASNEHILPCVSRCKSPVLVLDI